MLKEMTKAEMQLIGGAGDGNNGGDRDHSRSSYGAQANGFQPNWAAKGHGLFQDASRPCPSAIINGVLGVGSALASRNATAIGIMATAAFVNIGGQCNKDSGRDRGVPFR